MTDLFFDYHLPAHLIAQHPAGRRDGSRLMVLDRAAGSVSHHHFRDLPQFLRPNDLLVLNDTKVIPARVVGVRANTGGKWEGLFLHEASGAWEMLAQTRGYPEVGERFALPTGLTLTLIGRTADRHWLMTPDRPGTAADLLTEHGHIPLPPYIRKGNDGPEDRERYQTVYAEHTGSVAAPTAGLHFTPELLAELSAKGVGTARVTLHVGLGTFAPVKADDPLTHRIHAEWAEVRRETADAINRTKATGGRVVAVGTTTTRTLETAFRTPRPWGRGAGGEGASSSPPPREGEVGEAQPSRVRGGWRNDPPPATTCGRDDIPLTGGGVQHRGEGCKAFRGETGLFIHPPFEFRALDGLITNFHLPRTTLLLLAQAFAGSELLRRGYEEAVREGYRFFSYGDAMLIV